MLLLEVYYLLKREYFFKVKNNMLRNIKYLIFNIFLNKYEVILIKINI